MKISVCDYCGTAESLLKPDGYDGFFEDKDICPTCLKVFEAASIVLNKQVEKIHSITQRNYITFFWLLVRTDDEIIKEVYGEMGLKLKREVIEHTPLDKDGTPTEFSKL